MDTNLAGDHYCAACLREIEEYESEPPCTGMDTSYD
jgi:hypothetical protein